MEDDDSSDDGAADGGDPFQRYGLEPIRLEDRDVFQQCFSHCRDRLSDYSFANTYIWREPIHLRWKRIRDCLCVFANGDGGLTLLFPPVGPGDTMAALRDCLEVCNAYNADFGFDGCTRVEYVSREMLDKFRGEFRAEPMSGDYVYHTQRMIDLAGGDLASKRQLKNRYARRYEARTEDYRPERHAELCLALLDKWKFQSEEKHPARPITEIRRTKEVIASAEALRHSDALGLRGMMLYAGEQLVGFTLGEMLDETSCSILIEKTDREFTGSAQYIFSEFCRQHWSHAEWCNVGDDWEIPSLAWTKESYRPAHRLDKWVVHPVQPVVKVVHTPPPAPAQTETPAPDEQRAELRDLDALVDLENRCFGQCEAFSRRQLRYLLRSPHASVHVIRRDDRIVAEALLLRRRGRNGTTARLYSLAVDSDFRGQGFGRQMLAQCLDVLRAQGIGTVVLEVAAENAPAIGLYASAGFVKTKLLHDYYAPGKDAWKMRLAPSPAPTPSAAQAGRLETALAK